MLNQWLKSASFISAVVLSSVLLTACSDDTTLGSKSLVEEQTFTIPRPAFIPPGIVIPVPIRVSVPINLAEQPGYNEDDLNFVTSVSVREITFTINPGSNDASLDAQEDGNLDSFEFISGLELSLAAVVDGVAQEVKVASLPMSDPQIASDLSTLTLDVQNTDIRDLIEAQDGSDLIIEVSGMTPPDDVIVDAKIRFRVGLGIR